MDKRLKIFVCHVNILQVTGVGGDLNNQVGTMTCSVNSQSLSPVILTTTKQAFETSDGGGKDGSYTWSGSRGQLHSNTDLDLVTVQCQISQQQGPTRSPS